MKDGFDPFQRTGINSFTYGGESVLIVHPGAYLQSVTPGQFVMFRRYDGLVWCGRTWQDCYVFELEAPVNTWDALHWLNEQYRKKIRDEEIMSTGQDELPFG